MFFDSEHEKSLELLIDAYGLPIDDSSNWWVKHPKRAIEEIFLMEENTNSLFRVRGNQLVWEESIKTNFGQTYRISIESQPEHPFSIPKVFVLMPHITGNIHRYNDGSLCLFHPDDYFSEMTILDIRNKAVAWCFCHDAHEQTGEWPAAERPH